MPIGLLRGPGSDRLGKNVCGTASPYCSGACVGKLASAGASWTAGPLFDEAGGREAFDKGHDLDFTAPRCDFHRTHDGSGVVVAAFDQDVRTSSDNHFQG